jgi:hypothetical protein
LVKKTEGILGVNSKFVVTIGVDVDATFKKIDVMRKKANAITSNMIQFVFSK